MKSHFQGRTVFWIQFSVTVNSESTLQLFFEDPLFHSAFFHSLSQIIKNNYQDNSLKYEAISGPSLSLVCDNITTGDHLGNLRNIDFVNKATELLFCV